MSNLVDRIVQELLERYVGGIPFFDNLDATWRSPRGWPVVEELLARSRVRLCPDYPDAFGITFPGATPVGTGRFGMFLHNAFEIGLLMVTGGLRTDAPMDDLWYVRPRCQSSPNREFVLLDDSFYSGQTRNLIRSELGRQGGRLVHTYVIYDGSRQRDPEVTGMYRYYDHFAPDSTRTNPNVRISNQ